MGALSEENSGLLDLVLNPKGTPPSLEALVSASDLQASLDRIKFKSDDLRDQVQKVVTKHQGEFARIVAQAESTTDNVSNLSGELGKASELLDGVQGSGADIISSAAEFSKLQDEIAAKQRAVHAVSLVSFLQKYLKALVGEVTGGELQIAAGSLKDLEGHMSKLPKAAREPVVFGHLRNGLSVQRRELESLLATLFAESLIVDKSRAEIKVNGTVLCKEKPVSTESVWEALETLGLLGSRMEKLAEQLFEGPITACLQSSDPKIAIPIDHNKKDAGSQEAKKGKGQPPAILRWSTSEGSSVPGPLEVYSHLQHVVHFLQKHVANKDRSNTFRLGKLLWPRIARALTDGPLLASVPTEVSKLPEFEVFAKASQEFERALEAESFIPTLEGGHELSAFARDINVHFADKKRTSFLARARHSLTQPDWCYKTVEVGSASKQASTSSPQKPAISAKKAKPLGRKGGPGRAAEEVEDDAREAARDSGAPGISGRDTSGPFLQLPTCQVSEAVQQLVQLAHEALQEASRSTVQIARELHRTARDVLELYRAIVPVQRRHQLESVPQLAMVFHNDCLYIRHHVMLLGLQYKSPSTFLDLVPPFQQLAERTRLRHVAQQREELMRALDEAKGFKYTDEEANFKGAERAIKKVLHILGHLSAIWRPVLSADVLSVIMTSLAEASVARVATEVLQLDDIAVEETTQLRQLFRTLLEGLPEILRGAQQNKEELSADKKVELVLMQVSTAPKLQRLIDILDMSLRDINAAWESGNLPSCGFKAHEVQRLIKAIFSETPLQKEVLDRIEARKG